MDHVPARPLLRTLRTLRANAAELLDVLFFPAIDLADYLFLDDHDGEMQPPNTERSLVHLTAASDALDAQPGNEDAPENLGEHAGSGANTENQENDAEGLGTTRHIPHQKLQQLAVDHLGNRHGDACEVVVVHEGSFNRVYIVCFLDGTKYAIRIPNSGTPERWLAGDAVALRSQVCTMKYIKQRTNLPVPEVLAYSTTCNNTIGHPYMITTFLNGRQVCEVWNEGAHSLEREAKRLAILKSIVYTMKKLSKLTFEAAGSLYFDGNDGCDPIVGPLYVMDEDFATGTRSASFRESYMDSYQESRKKLHKWWQDMCASHGGEPQDLDRGMYVFMATMIDCLPFHKSIILKYTQGNDNMATNNPGSKNDKQDETVREHFVLAPPNFNWQNILVDENNIVTGLLDWDKVCTVPRYLGWAAYPLWLSEDYDLDYAWQGDPHHTDHDIERYRQIYAEFMAEAMGGESDCKFTAKSHLFQALDVALTQPTQTFFLLTQILRILLPRTDAAEYLVGLTHGWRPGERVWLRKKMGEMFDCTPGADYRLSF